MYQRVWLEKLPLSVLTCGLLAVLFGTQFFMEAFAQTSPSTHIITLTAEKNSVVIGKGALEWLEDKAGAYTLESLRRDSSLRWTSSQDDKPGFGFTRSVYWFRFTAQNLVPERVWLLEIDYPPLDYGSIFSPERHSSGYREQKFGDRLTFANRLIPHRNYIFPLESSDSLPRTYYLRIQTESSLQMPLTLFERNEFERTSMGIDLFYGALFGAMLTLAAYNLILFVAMRVPSYLFFVLYMTATAWYYASISGYVQFPLGNLPTLANTLTLFALFLSYSSLSLFGRVFLQTFRVAPVLDRFHLWFGVLGYVCSGLVLFVPYRIGALSGAALVFAVTVLCLVSGFILALRGNRSALYFLAALWVFLFSALVTLLRNLGVIPSGAISVHSVEIGSALEGIMFSFALAGQYRMLRKQKENAQAEALRLQKEANEQLEKKVQERTKALEASNEEIQRQLEILDEQSREIEIANTTLQEKNIQLEDLNREKNEFLGIAAHDLKNPLSSITMSASIVLSYRDKITEEQLEERLQTILATSGRMMEIIKNLLDVNAIESGQFAFTVEQVDISDIASALVNEYRDRAAAKSIELFYENSAVQTHVMGDKTALTEVFENLISNAVKYSPPKKRVFIAVTNPSILHERTTRVIFSVRDEGPGISDDDKKRLFGKFARLSAQPTGGEHSTGLGLSIVKKMVEAMHGRVWCESEFGKGATFIVELPINTGVSG